MDTSFLGEVAKILASTGPWGLVVALAWAYWRVSTRKEDEFKALYQQLTELQKAQTAALVRVEESLDAMRDMIGTAFLRYYKGSYPARPSPPPPKDKSST
jgi:hypothetical protein